jgi:hypothetical protein|tara:strand:- start:617 stop:1600 length:984 start_codon:yes stop_codon:yes gene_type:complete
MLNYKKIIAGQLPEASWYENLQLPEGRTYIVRERNLYSLDEVGITNDAGQEVNVARSIGTDRVNKELIKSNMAVHGLLTSVQPPYIYKSNLYDGFTRYGAMLELGLTHGIFNELELKDGFTEKEMLDEIGLGANDHPPSKGATINDFKRRLNGHISLYLTENDVLPSTGYCIDWINNIPHSFFQKQVIDIADECLKKHRCSASVVAIDSPKANAFAARHCPNNLKVVPLNVSAQKGGGIKTTYFDRAFISAFYGAGELSFIGYTQGIEADEVPYFREKAQEKVDSANGAFEAAFQKRLEEGKNFKMFKLEGFIPQIIGEEDSTELVK